MKYFVIIIVILYSQNVESDWVNMKNFTANGQREPLEVSEGDNVSLSCEIEGNPRPAIYLTRHNTEEILQVVTTNSNAANVYTTKVTANLDMKCEDTGMYTCLFGEEGQTILEKFISVFVKCTPVLISSEEFTMKFDITTGADLKFDINIYGYPEPHTYTVHHLEDSSGRYIGKPIPQLGKHSLTYNQVDGAEGQVVLKMIGMRDSDSGKYELRIKNGIGIGLGYIFNVIVNSAYKTLVECNSIQSANTGTSSDPSMNVVWTCSISGVDHPPSCHFQYTLHGQTGGDQPVHATYIENKPSTWTGNPPQYDKVCTMTFPVTSLLPNDYEFKAIIYPSFLGQSLGKSMESVFKLNLKTPTCADPIISDDQQTVSVSCQSSGLYPRVVCSFQHSKYKKGYTDSDGMITTNLPHCPVKQASCFYHCTLSSNIGELGEGSYAFKVRMMPILHQGMKNAPGIESGPSPSIYLVGKMRKCRRDTPARNAILDPSHNDYCEPAPPIPPRSTQETDRSQNRYTYEIPVELKRVDSGHYSEYISLDVGALPQ